MYPRAASAIEQVALFVHAAERQLAVIDADPPTDWALDTAAPRAAARDALRRLHVYPPPTSQVAVTDADPTDEGPAVLYELAGIVAQMIEPDTLPAGMLLTVVTTVDAATEALIDAGL
jgi:7-keto-8-aminopelargonate synthetase-like enzyme